MPLVLRNAPVNASVLYTIGEEGGMLGVLDLVRGLYSGTAGGVPRDAVWIIVDGSNRTMATRIGLDAWKELRWIRGDLSPDAAPDGPPAGPVSMETVAIRLEDRWTVYDPGAALLLYQAALTARARIATSRRDAERFGAPNRDPRNDADHAALKGISHADLGLAGMFHGGACEATALNLAPLLARADGAGKFAPMRVGALAIPLRNHGNIMTGQLMYEQCHTGALRSAVQVLASACRLIAGYEFPAPPAARFRKPDELVSFFREVSSEADSRLQPIRSWVARLGARRVAPST